MENTYVYLILGFSLLAFEIVGLVGHVVEWKGVRVVEGSGGFVQDISESGRVAFGAFEEEMVGGVAFGVGIHGLENFCHFFLVLEFDFNYVSWGCIFLFFVDD